MRSTPEYESHDFAEDTRRPAFSAPRLWASVPTTWRRGFVPGQSEEPAGKSIGPGEIEKGRQQRLGADFAGVDELRDREQLDRGQAERVGGGGHVE